VDVNLVDAPIICLMGPTASGKTDLAVKLVQNFPCEIISVDSAMVYRGMNIGTAKPDAKTLAIAPHWLLDIRDPADIYSAAQFCRDACLAIADIQSRNKIPLLVGGSMLYFRVLLNGFSDLPSANQAIRDQLNLEAKKIGWQGLHEKLQAIDPIVAARIHPHDSQRIQRALEVIYLSGKNISELQNKNQIWLKNNKIIKFVLAPNDRAILHERIAVRFKQMLQDGLIDEVKLLFVRNDLNIETPSVRAAGYRQVWLYLAGELTLSEMENLGVIATRQLAKRQLTWLRHWPDITAWFDSEAPNLFQLISNELLYLFKK